MQELPCGVAEVKVRLMGLDVVHEVSTIRGRRYSDGERCLMLGAASWVERHHFVLGSDDDGPTERM
jgi:hypothetical protein